MMMINTPPMVLTTLNLSPHTLSLSLKPNPSIPTPPMFSRPHTHTACTRSTYTHLRSIHTRSSRSPSIPTLRTRSTPNTPNTPSSTPNTPRSLLNTNSIPAPNSPNTLTNNTLRSTPTDTPRNTLILSTLTSLLNKDRTPNTHTLNTPSTRSTPTTFSIRGTRRHTIVAGQSEDRHTLVTAPPQTGSAMFLESILQSVGVSSIKLLILLNVTMF